jgi:hypothetical protein
VCKDVPTWIVEVSLGYANLNGEDKEGEGRGGRCIIMDYRWAKLVSMYGIALATIFSG